MGGTSGVIQIPPFFDLTQQQIKFNQMETTLRTFTFIAPSGHSFEIREQNGEDEEILSNQADARNLMNLTKFIAGIVVSTNFTTSGKLLVKDVLDLPLLDRYAILFQSRIFSLGNMITFEYTWSKDNKVQYEQDLREFLFDDYSKAPTEEELDAKPDAVPYYPNITQAKDNELKLSSGKIVQWDYLDGNGEIFLLNLPDNKKTRNSDLLARNLRLNVDGKFEKVTNFRLFSVRDMAEMRNGILSQDPIFQGLTDIENPSTGEVTKYPILAAPTFFYLTEA